MHLQICINHFLFAGKHKVTHCLSIMMFPVLVIAEHNQQWIQQEDGIPCCLSLHYNCPLHWYETTAKLNCFAYYISLIIRSKIIKMISYHKLTRLEMCIFVFSNRIISVNIQSKWLDITSTLEWLSWRAVIITTTNQWHSK